MRLSLVGALALALASTSLTEALPRVRTYRGRSRYEAMYTEPEPVPRLPDPRTHPDFYTHRSTPEYQQQGFEPARPAWAQSMLDTVESILDGIGVDLLALPKLLSPYFAAKAQYAADVARFTFNPSGDDGFLHLEPDGKRVVLGEGNASISSLPAGSGFDYNNDKVRGVNIGNWVSGVGA